MSGCLRLSLWSGPRNISTALMYAFRQRSDTVVVDEPLYGHYLRVTGAEHPGAGDVLKAMDGDGERVVREILLAPCERPVLFAKNMAHHLVGLERGFLEKLTNLLLTRDPHDMLTSLVAQLPNPTLGDTGLEMQVEILEHELARGRAPVVLEAGEVLRNPRRVLSASCERLGLPFDEAMLTWPAGSKPEDGVWAKHWYANVHASTGFAPYWAKATTLPQRLEPLLDECMPYYERLNAYAVTASD
ncbi:MAG TPA: sulfotransferase family protein [Chloroflexota bacterium]|nr:sulfotransferase family protein [Chloroflexota bacterium]